MPTLSPAPARITILPTGTAASIAAGDTHLMTPELDTPPPPHGGDGAHAPGGSWVRPVALVASCLVIGFVGGWVFRGDDGPVTVLAPTAPIDSGDAGSVTTGDTSTAPGATTDVTTGATTTASAAPAPPPDRTDITLVVLNSTSVSGLAASTADQAESLGYPAVATGNAPTSTGPSIAYFTPGRRSAAQRVAKDLDVATVTALPASGALADTAPDGTDVVLVLGPG